MKIWKKARAVKASEEEYNKIIEHKTRERLNMQKKFRTTYLTRCYQEQKCLEMKKVIEQTKNGEVKWLGVLYPKTLLESDFNLELHKYKEILEEEVYLKRQLELLKLTEKQIQKIITDGIYIKDDVIEDKEK